MNTVCKKRKKGKGNCLEGGGGKKGSYLDVWTDVEYIESFWDNFSLGITWTQHNTDNFFHHTDKNPTRTRESEIDFLKPL